jgi:hypothetical protein
VSVLLSVWVISLQHRGVPYLFYKKKNITFFFTFTMAGHVRIYLNDERFFVK